MAAAQWWVVLQGQSGISQFIGGFLNPTQPIPQRATKAVVVQSATRPANYYKGPYPTQAAAQAQANAYDNPNLGSQAEEALNVGPASGSGAPASWNLAVSHISGWFFRGLKLLFGGVLMVIGVSRMTGWDNKLTQLASKVPVLP